MKKLFVSALAALALSAPASTLSAGVIERGSELIGNTYAPTAEITLGDGSEVTVSLGETVNGVEFTRSVIMSDWRAKAAAKLAFGEDFTAIKANSYPGDEEYIASENRFNSIGGGASW